MCHNKLDKEREAFEAINQTVTKQDGKSTQQMDEDNFNLHRDIHS